MFSAFWTFEIIRSYEVLASLPHVKMPVKGVGFHDATPLYVLTGYEVSSREREREREREDVLSLLDI